MLSKLERTFNAAVLKAATSPSPSPSLFKGELAAACQMVKYAKVNTDSAQEQGFPALVALVSLIFDVLGF
jgi:hypothetical protein